MLLDGAMGRAEGRAADQAILSADRRMTLRHGLRGRATLFLPVLWQGERRRRRARHPDRRAQEDPTLFWIARPRRERSTGPPAGLVLHALRHPARHRATALATYDFLRGNEPYKYSFGCEERRIKSLFLTTKDHRNPRRQARRQKRSAGPAARVRTASGGTA